jgi:hypothetical protein
VRRDDRKPHSALNDLLIEEMAEGLSQRAAIDALAQRIGVDTATTIRVLGRSGVDIEPRERPKHLRERLPVAPIPANPEALRAAYQARRQAGESAFDAIGAVARGCGQPVRLVKPLLREPSRAA